MSSPAKSTRATVIHCLRYRDAPAAIDWLCRAFGFEKQLVVPQSDGSIAHAQLTFGNGMVMLGSHREEEATSAAQPLASGISDARGAYLIAADADAVYRTAKAAGAVMIMEIQNMDYGGRGFTCRDPEGHVWHVGSYDPWSE